MTRPVWRNAPKPSGKYKAFEVWQWPYMFADTSEGRRLAMIICEDAYTPARARGEEEHRELSIYIADYRTEANPTGTAFTWRRLKRRAKRLAEAKAIAEECLKLRPEWFQPRG